ncbi:YaaA family protein [uncultured Porphyromonas sp.]|uniref:YaaA family protein n=1 Tax=uncultured Porphyromonas sp. TaxID=159274 RepID=UPI0025984B2A|nr:YaaA family protein [uncultured Porphyromonas sp.]
MFLLISPAKTFVTKAKVPRDLAMTSPRFLEEARTIMASVLRLSREELASMLQLSPKLRDEVYARLRTFFDPEVTEMPAALSYTGMVFRKLSPSTFTAEDWAYAAEHLRITSFVYGLLSPETAIRYDRMEGAVQLPDLFDGRLFDYWRDRLTPYLIEAVKRAGGTLLFLASDEMRGLFHWAEVERAVRVITPTFLVRQPTGRLKQIVVYTKMARGAMAGEVIRQRLEDEEALRMLTPEGFVFAPEESTDRDWTFVLG